MIILTKQELQNFKPINNCVLVTPLTDNTFVKVDNVELKLDTDFTEDAYTHIDVLHEVVAIPERLIMGKNGLEHLPVFDLKVGDKVIVAYNAIMFPSKSGQYFTCDGKKYFSVNFRELYCKTDPIIPLNGYALCEPFMDVTRFGVYNVTKENQRKAVVKYVGEKNLDYVERYVPNSNRMEKHEDVDVQVGDTIMFEKYNNKKIEGKIHATLGNLIAVPLRAIICKIETNE